MVSKRSSVFVVHGRNEKAREAMFIFLQSIGLHPLEWSEIVAKTRKGSPYVGDVLIKGFSISQAAVVLMTPDDEAQLHSSLRKDDEPTWETQLTLQPRQNVLFEAGMAMAKFPKRTIIIEMGKLRPFSDVIGRHVIKMEETPQKRNELATRLKSAGCKINLTGIRWLTSGNFDLEKTSQEIQLVKQPTEVSSSSEKPNSENGMKDLAQICGIPLSKLKDVISIKNDKVEIIAPIKGSDAKKQIIASECILAAYEIVFKQEWIKASLLTESLCAMGIQRLGNLSANLSRSSELFRKRGAKRNTEYKLTTAEGRISAYQIIRKLSNGEPFDEN
jgi:hypothetical protein